jgi:hypothetical protein
MKRYFLLFTLVPFLNTGYAQGKFFGGNDDGYASATSSLVVLAASLAELSATQCNKNICLEWTTLQEQNTNRFEIEKSTDGTDFIYTGQVAAAGNSNSLRHYSFTDQNPFTGINYYRLKLLGLDGKHSYSKTVSVKYKADKLIRSILNNYSRELTIQLNNNGEPVLLKIFDMNGKLLFSSTGRNNTIKPDIASFSTGLYLLVAELNGQFEIEKFIITD